MCALKHVKGGPSGTCMVIKFLNRSHLLLKVNGLKDTNGAKAAEQNQVTADQISNVKEMHWNTFEQFKRRAFGVWIVELPIEPSEWSVKYLYNYNFFEFF